jgi:transposase
MLSKHIMAKGVKSITTKLLGEAVLIKPIMDDLGISKVINKYAPMRETDLPHGEVIEIVILNRLTSPQPLYRIEDWARDYGVEEIYGIAQDRLNDDRVARSFDAISSHGDEIYMEMALNLITKFGIDPSKVLYDITSMYFEGEYDESEIITFGYSRDKRPDREQINIGLNLTLQGGIPIYHRILSGDTSDKTTVEENMNSLRKILPPSNIVVIGDRAMMTRPNIAKLKEKGLDYLGTLQAGKEEKEMMRAIGEEEFQRLDWEPKNGDGTYYGAEREIKFTYQGKRYTSRAIVIKSFHKEEKDRAKRQKALDEISSQLEEIKHKLNARRYKRVAYVEEMIGKVFSPKGKKGMQRFFEVTLEGDEGELCFDYHIKEEEVAREARLDGKYILVTSLTSSMNEALRDYKGMNKMDRRMSFLKGPLKIRPVFLQRDDRIRALVLVNILALMVYSLLEWVASRRGIDGTGRYLFSWFRYFSLVKIEFDDGEKVVLLESLKEEQRGILQRLGFPEPGYLVGG